MVQSLVPTANVSFLAVTDFSQVGTEEKITLNVKNSGLSARTILPSLAFMLLSPRANCSVFLDGVERMRARPMSELFSVLENLGLKILFPKQQAHYRASYHRVQEERLLRLELIAACLARFLRILQILPFLNSIFRKNKINALGTIVSRPYIDLTMHVLSKFGCSIVETSPGQFYTPALSVQSPKNFTVEGDASSASYFFASACIGGGPSEFTEFLKIRSKVISSS